MRNASHLELHCHSEMLFKMNSGMANTSDTTEIALELKFAELFLGYLGKSLGSDHFIFVFVFFLFTGAHSSYM